MTLEVYLRKFYEPRYFGQEKVLSRFFSKDSNIVKPESDLLPNFSHDSIIDEYEESHKARIGMFIGLPNTGKRTLARVCALNNRLNFVEVTQSQFFKLEFWIHKLQAQLVNKDLGFLFFFSKFSKYGTLNEISYFLNVLKSHFVNKRRMFFIFDFENFDNFESLKDTSFYNKNSIDIDDNEEKNEKFYERILMKEFFSLISEPFYIGLPNSVERANFFIRGIIKGGIFSQFLDKKYFMFDDKERENPILENFENLLNSITYPSYQNITEFSNFSERNFKKEILKKEEERKKRESKKKMKENEEYKDKIISETTEENLNENKNFNKRLFSRKEIYPPTKLQVPYSESFIRYVTNSLKGCDFIMINNLIEKIKESNNVIPKKKFILSLLKNKNFRLEIEKNIQRHAKFEEYYNKFIKDVFDLPNRTIEEINNATDVQTALEIDNKYVENEKIYEETAPSFLLTSGSGKIKEKLLICCFKMMCWIEKKKFDDGSRELEVLTPSLDVKTSIQTASTIYSDDIIMVYVLLNDIDEILKENFVTIRDFKKKIKEQANFKNNMDIWRRDGRPIDEKNLNRIFQKDENALISNRKKIENFLLINKEWNEDEEIHYLNFLIAKRKFDKNL